MLTINQISELNWKKVNQLIPIIVQDISSNEILMHGYVNQESLLITLKKKKITFFSRTKNRLWTKGETSKNYLKVINIIPDCDKDSLLALVQPIGNTCHLNNKSCFQNKKNINISFILELERILKNYKNNNNNTSYTSNLYKKGINKISQKIGEEAVELVIAAVNQDKKNVFEECADLMYHILVLFSYIDIKFIDLIKVLKKRNT
ncbi:bifunctional phosphoribosyl-AMP cyclohydrolase/phosphoribosyl-ATP diphosphatase HisIE [Buchnera aphidicola]|uniref:bifunctional phosphoribosyl-AMP cyclohydrolase/phosphoribosyl-ATP diphosphatase HisIE n=1 Tax=Buchnera aphidicola TaxID=9 RepID=UPI0022378683|nr:bifunctional phosphoribosyl-AMP cyclohydrolase/phosphoribosyl-ATP diphosphatase HisIE [Buchnera aphidicola]MCW5197612.1 bifunctional phosphoribosyl-AMP cyclohydrolase/phosphoribosyl-ATP diphosphatase HisIE [Buchnera aphidicola (Chaitophorus viminalis)]